MKMVYNNKRYKELVMRAKELEQKGTNLFREDSKAFF